MKQGSGEASRCEKSTGENNQFYREKSGKCEKTTKENVHSCPEKKVMVKSKHEKILSLIEKSKSS